MTDSDGFEDHTLDTLRERLGFPTRRSVQGRVKRAAQADVELRYQERGNGPNWYRISVDWIDHQRQKPPRTTAEDKQRPNQYDIMAEKDRRIGDLQAALTYERQTTQWLRDRVDQLESELARLRGTKAQG